MSENTTVADAVRDYAVVDIFCGVGGLTHGLILEGFEVVAGVDSDESCRYAYQTNNGAKFIGKKVEDLRPGEIGELFPTRKKRVLVGCAPCQPFSSNNTKQQRGDKWQLLYNFADLVTEVKPDVVSMENVTRLITFDKGRVFREFVERLEKLGYHVTWYEVYCPDYGIPQRRKRLVLFASKHGRVELVPPTHTPDNYQTVKDAIGHLPSIEAGCPHPHDPLHWSPRLSPKNQARILASKPGGTWRDWDEELVAECHRKESGQRGPSFYGRMRWDEPSPTITTQFFGFGNGRFGHPEQNRALSLREGAILQTFPDDYKFVAPGAKITFEHVGRQIGNAVPVVLGRVIARSMKEHLARHSSTGQSSESPEVQRKGRTSHRSRMPKTLSRP